MPSQPRFVCLHFLGYSSSPSSFILARPPTPPPPPPPPPPPSGLARDVVLLLGTGRARDGSPLLPCSPSTPQAGLQVYVSVHIDMKFESSSSWNLIRESDVASNAPSIYKMATRMLKGVEGVAEVIGKSDDRGESCGGVGPAALRMRGLGDTKEGSRQSSSDLNPLHAACHHYTQCPHHRVIHWKGPLDLSHSDTWGE
ncbi:hypothetical protein O3P69_008246 [Scylla paramamosain]|uniref:Uncharacterized protein n=1 Tax=Scylla paramamosain TaxID=85552 RepID=A0AAW0T1Y4_SCYPA